MKTNKNKGKNSLTRQKESINQKEILSDEDCFGDEIIEDIFDLYPGYKITNVDYSQDGGTIYYTIVEKEKEKPCCPYCGSNNIFKHGYQKCSLKDSKIGTQKVKVTCFTQRYKCTACNKTFASKISFKHPQHNITLRLFNVIKEMMNIGQVSASFVETQLGVSRKAIMKIYKDNAKH